MKATIFKAFVLCRRDGEGREPFAIELGDIVPMPAQMVLDADLAGLVDDKLRHLDRLQQRQDRCEIMAQDGGIAHPQRRNSRL